MVIKINQYKIMNTVIFMTEALTLLPYYSPTNQATISKPRLNQC